MVIRFGHDTDSVCMQMDETLAGIADAVKAFAVIYLVDISEVPEFNDMYELFDPCTVMFFFRNKHIMIDLGTGNNNKITWAMSSKQEMIDILETVYRGARKGRGLVISPKDYSTKYKCVHAPTGVAHCVLLPRLYETRLLTRVCKPRREFYSVLLFGLRCYHAPSCRY